MNTTHEFTGSDFRAMAKQCNDTRNESFDRCDTDGFLSQWANQRMESTYLHAASIAENGYTVEVCSIFNLDGELMEAEQRSGDYGAYWFVFKVEGKARFFSESYAQNRKIAVKNNAKKGYYVGTALWNVTIDRMGTVKYVDVAGIVDDGQEELKGFGLI